MGTTNIVVSNGSSVQRFKNSQSRFGSDIISRILNAHYNGVSPLQKALLTSLIQSFKILDSQNTTTAKTMVFTGNTVMMHFLTGLDVSGMETYPFTPVSTFSKEYYAGDIFSSIDKGLWESLFTSDTKIYLPPCIDAFVGADLVCAAVGCDLFGIDTDLTDKTKLLIDIGTNTEILLKHNNKYYACATAAGPAFEGGNMKSSLRGSELLHTLSIMLDEGHMDKTGMLVKDKSFLIQEDIRQLQLAKAAICSGVETLLQEASLGSADVSNVFLCGAFGTNILPYDIGKTGLLNEILSKKVTVNEFAVIDGAKKLLLSSSLRGFVQEQAAKTNVIQLANNDFFAKEYIHCIDF